jgi:PAS domain S-box-containing protein
LENLKQTFEEGPIKDLEYAFLTGEGQEFPALLSASVLKDAEGKPCGFVAITRDVSEERRMLDELRRYHLSLAEGTDEEMWNQLETHAPVRD